MTRVQREVRRWLAKRHSVNPGKILMVMCGRSGSRKVRTLIGIVGGDRTVHVVDLEYDSRVAQLRRGVELASSRSFGSRQRRSAVLILRGVDTVVGDSQLCAELVEILTNGARKALVVMATARDWHRVPRDLRALAEKVNVYSVAREKRRGSQGALGGAEGERRKRAKSEEGAMTVGDKFCSVYDAVRSSCGRYDGHFAKVASDPEHRQVAMAVVAHNAGVIAAGPDPMDRASDILDACSLADTVAPWFMDGGWAGQLLARGIGVYARKNSNLDVVASGLPYWQVGNSKKKRTTTGGPFYEAALEHKILAGKQAALEHKKT